MLFKKYKQKTKILKKYENIPEFSNFIKEFSSLIGGHFNNLENNPISGNMNFNLPEIQEIINDPKIKPILQRLQQEGKLDINKFFNPIIM